MWIQEWCIKWVTKASNNVEQRHQVKWSLKHKAISLRWSIKHANDGVYNPQLSLTFLMCSVGRWTNFVYPQWWWAFQVTITILTDDLTDFMANSGNLTQFTKVRGIFTENGGNVAGILSMMAESLPDFMMNSDQLTQFVNVPTILTASRHGIQAILMMTVWDSSDISSNGGKKLMWYLLWWQHIQPQVFYQHWGKT